jgi:hypothetical protein
MQFRQRATGEPLEPHVRIDLPWDEPLKVEAVAERFLRTTLNRFKPGSLTPSEYLRIFRRFARDPGCNPHKSWTWTYDRFEALTKQQLKARGKDMTLDFMATVPLKSR